MSLVHYPTPNYGVNIYVDFWKGMIKNTDSGHDRLIYMSYICQELGLIVYEWKGKTSVSSGHAAGGYHYQTFPNSRLGRAFDAYYPIGKAGANAKMLRCALYFRDNLSPYLTEGIYNGQKPGHNLSVKNGHRGSKNLWSSDTWNNHKTHVHIAI